MAFIMIRTIGGPCWSVTVLAVVLAMVPPKLVLAQDAATRPKVLGVAHMAIYVKDLDKTRKFYEEFLGFGEPFTLPKKTGGGVRIAFVKVNDHQYFEIFNESDRGEGQLNHISFYTDDADRMYRYLKSKNIVVMSDKGSVGKGQTGNKNFNVQDPDGHIVELATVGPGFLADETEVDLGRSLRLPPWLESAREEIAGGLRPLRVPAWQPAE